MSNFAPKSKPALLAISALLFVGAAVLFFGPHSLALTNGGSITSFGSPLTEDFNTLAQTGTGIAWADNTTIPGWYSTRVTYNSGTGSSNAGALYSYGVAGVNPVTDRALGSIASSGTGTVYWGARFVNNTGGTITSLNVSYFGEQWRTGGSSTATPSVAQTTDFQYQVVNAGAISGINTPSTGWLDHDLLDFSSPIFGTTVPSALDGNAAANRVALSSTISVSVAPGQEVWLRWRDVDHANNDHGLAADDLSVTANGVPPSPTPTPTPTPTPPPNDVVISQVYGGGGNTGATLTHDYIELVNHSGAPVNLNGWSVQAFVTPMTGPSSWEVTPLPNFTLQPGQYFLIQEAPGAGGTTPLPAPDATGTIAVSSTSTKVALVNNTTQITAACPDAGAAGIVDLVGYGPTDCFEGAAPAPLLDNTTANFRHNEGCFDTNQNANDFFTSSPSPRNSSSPFHDCTSLSAYGTANPSSVIQGGSSTLTVYVAAAQNPSSTGITVTADLSQIGGSPTQSFSGSGSVFSFVATVPIGNSTGMKSLPVTVTDGQARSFNTSILLSVLPLVADHITISEIYGGGGNASATYTNDYVELYNPTASTVNVTGWSLQYASAAGTSWTNKQPIGGTIGPGEYYLVELASGGANGAPLPVTPNISGGINMSATTGKIALVSNSANLSGGCPLGTDPDIVDFVGYGNSATCHEGSANTAQPGNNATSINRKNNGSLDADQNGSDFQLLAPNPQRTAIITELGPWVSGIDPSTNDVDVPYDATITVNFSEPVNVDPGWFNITCTNTGAHNPPNVTEAHTTDLKTYAITPNLSFQFSEQCTVTVFKTAVHDVDSDDSGPDTDTLFADETWSFTVVAPGQPAPYLSSVHMTFGNPSNATPLLSDFNNFLMEKPTYALSYSRDRGTPNWVSWHLTSEWYGTLARVDTFRPDPKVDPSWYRVQAFDYAGSGFDRGHMTPNADRDNQNRIPINQETYLMTNMVPQSPANNQGPWADLEAYLRTQTDVGQEIYIVAGPNGVGGIGSASGNTVNTIANGNVTVPSSTWKVALFLTQATGDDIARVNCSTRTLAVIMPNNQSLNGDWNTHITTVDAVEALTGYDFFSNLPPAVQACVEAGTNGTNPPGTANQSANTQEDTPVEITLQALRSNNNTLTFSIVSDPSNGSLGSVGAATCSGGSCTATVTYTPGPDYNGSDSFTFKASDGGTDSNTSSVNLGISAVNDAPVAANDDYTTNPNATLNVPAPGVLSNDTDVDNASLSSVLVSGSGPTHGSLTFNSDGSFSYSPDLNYTGPDSFSYRAFDGSAYSDPATVSIAVDDTVAPVITSSVVINLLTNTNSDLINVGLNASATDNSGGPVQIQVAVFGDENDETPTKQNTVHSPDAKDIGPNNTLRLRGERVEANDGRVYLIRVTATDLSGNVSRSYHSVVVPKNNKQGSLDLAINQGAAAVSFAETNGGTPPSGYFIIGDGPIIGPKQ